MISAFDSSLSGLSAASKRLEVSASNIANQSSTNSLVNGQPVSKPYVPLRVDQVSLSDGGVQALTEAVDPATVSAPNLSGSGDMIELPNVDTATEMVGQNIAAYDFKANLKSIKAQDNMQKSLLDILS